MSATASTINVISARLIAAAISARISTLIVARRAVRQKTARSTCGRYNRRSRAIMTQIWRRQRSAGDKQGHIRWRFTREGACFLQHNDGQETGDQADEAGNVLICILGRGVGR